MSPRSSSRARFAVRVACCGLVAYATLSACSNAPPGTVADTTAGSETTGSSGETTSAPPSQLPDPPPPPEVGACRRLVAADTTLFSNDDPTVVCDQPHTSYTYAVKTLPDDIAFAGVKIENDAIQAAAASACQSQFGAFIGGDPADRAIARVGVTYFLPNQRGFDLGARWVRCDVISTSRAHSLGDLPADVEGMLDDPDTLAAYAVCSQGEPATEGSNLVVCSLDHTYRAVAALQLGKVDDAYPGEDTTLADGKEQCKDLISDLLGIKGGFTYSWTFPSEDDWADGQRFGYCWNETDA